MPGPVPTLIAPVVIIVVAIPLIAGLIGRNSLYGFRTPRTMSSDDVWYPANRVGGVLMLIAGIVWLVAGRAAPMSAVFTGVVSIGVALVIWAIYMRRFRT